jgi:ATP/maltotriose-dependent transcriptional regulator MalT/DNA-binding SARP family transcriptional activator
MTIANPVRAAPRERISRPELSRCIRDALERGSLLVVADAGFGKTLALEGALMDWPTVAWIACRRVDRDPGRLMVSMMAALRRAMPGAVDVQVDRLMAGAGMVDPMLAVQALMEELELLMVEPVIVVFDDAEWLADSRGARAFIAALLRRGTRMRVAISSRRDLGLETAKLRGMRALTVLGNAELAFTHQECERFLAMRMDRDPVADEVAQAMEATAGWPLALELGAASGERFGRGSASRRATFEYLAEEVLATVERDLRERVLDSSVPDELTPAVIGSLKLPDDFVSRAQTSGLFLRRVDAERDVFAYHPLFREFLLENLKSQRSDPELRRLHALAARGLAASGRATDSVDHWLEAQEWTEAIGAMADASPGLLRTSPATLAAWLKRLPRTLRRAAPCLLIEGQMAWRAGRHEQAKPLLRDAIAGYATSGELEGEWMARWILGDVLFSTGEFDEMHRLADDWDRYEPLVSPLGAGGAAFFRALGLAIAGRTEEAETLATRVSRTRAGAMLGPSLRAGVRAIGEAAAGRIEPLIEAQIADIAGLGLADPAGQRPYMVATVSLLLMDIGEYDAALRSWARTKEEASRYGLAWVIANSGFEEATILALQGKRVEAELALARAGPALGTGWRDHSFYKAQATIAGLRNQQAQALAAAERALDLAAYAPMPYQVWSAVQLSPTMEACGAGRRASKAVDAVLDLLDRRFPGHRGAYHRSRLLASRAWLHERAGHAAAAEDAVRRSFAEAGDAARHVLRSEWSRVEPIVWRALENRLLEPTIVINEVAAALPGGSALVPLTHHPLPAVRQIAIGAAAASGHPDAIANLRQIARRKEPGQATAAAIALERLRLAPPPLAFTVLGGFALTRGSWRADDAAWERRVAQRMVRFLLLHRDLPVSEDELLEVFWPDRDVQSARRSLRVATSRARGVLDIPGSASVIEIADRMYCLRLRQGDSVDADDFEAAAIAALAERGEARVRLLERAASRWGGEPLPEERYSDWTVPWRERLVDLQASVLAGLSDACLERGDLVGAVLPARDLVALDPLNEGAHRRLMVAYARAGSRSQALRQFLACRRELVEQLGVEPASLTAYLQQRILAGEPV